MKSYLKYLLIGLIGISIFTACSKDQNQEIILQEVIPEPTKKVYAKINGVVMDEVEKVIVGAAVNVYDQRVITDENGFFQIDGFFPEKGTQIRVRKEGYFEANGLILPRVDVITKVNIMLIENVQTGSYNSGNKIEYSSEHAAASFPKSAFVHQNGSPYAGTVQLSGKYVDPTHDHFYEMYPGVLKASEGEKQLLLQPFSLLKMELFDDAGTALQVNQNVELRMDVPQDLLADAPREIPLWYLDTEKGLWIEDGTAYLEGDQYVGIVTHFTDWLAALGFEYHTMSGSISKENAPYPFANMSVVYGGKIRFPFKSDENGNFSTPVIIGDQFGSNLFDGFGLQVLSHCDKVLYEEKDLPSPTADFSKNFAVNDSESFTITGNVYCETPNSGNRDAYVIVDFPESDYREILTTDSDGNFTLVIADCGLSNITISGYDPMNEVKSNAIYINSASSAVQLDICAAPFEGAIVFDLEGEIPYVIPNVSVEVITDTPGYKLYRFTATDFFPDFPEYKEYTGDYKIDVYEKIPSEEGQHPFTFVWPKVNIWDAPIQYNFSTDFSEVIEETEEYVIAEVRGADPFLVTKTTISKLGPEEWDTKRVELVGTVRIKGYK